MRRYAVWFDMTPKKATVIAKNLTAMAKKIVGDYEYVDFGFSNMADDGYRGIIFNMTYENELVDDIEYEQTMKNFKRNEKYREPVRVKDKKTEKEFLDLVEKGDELPDEYWEKYKVKESSSLPYGGMRSLIERLENLNEANRSNKGRWK